MKNKGFTLTELLGVIVLLAIISGLAVISVNNVIQTGKKGVYKNHETTLRGAIDDYLMDHFEDIPLVEGSRTWSISDLDSYLDELKDPSGGNCNSSYVKVTRHADISGNYSLDYQICLICKLDDETETYASDMESDDKFCH